MQLTVAEAMFYVYPTPTQTTPPEVPTPPKTDKGTPAADLPPLPARDTLPVPKITLVAATPDGVVVAAGGYFPGVRLLGRGKGAEKPMTLGQETAEKLVVLSPDGRFLACAGSGEAVRVWEVATGAELGSLAVASTDATAAVFSPDGKTLYLGGRDEKDVKLWDTTSRKVRGTLPHRSVSAVALTPDGRFLATAAGEIRVWDVAAGGDPVATMRGHTGLIQAVALTPDGKTAVTGSADGLIKVWDTATGGERYSIDGHRGRQLGGLAGALPGRKGGGVRGGGRRGGGVGGRHRPGSGCGPGGGRGGLRGRDHRRR
jgi:WD40 repeat protein